ncbi:MAG: M20 family metallopeptidase [Micrococcaceae bacterium]|nr:M20 family metallopeptidase [Micrococcaceae bacterium]
MTDSQAALADLAAKWSSALERELPAALELRRALHRNPRGSGNEHDTAARLERELAGFVNLQPVAGTGRVGRVGPLQGPAVGLRAELDALPMTERAHAFASTNGSMHACGHDVHQAALVALVRASAGFDLPVGLVPLLQPREETYPSGALDIVGAGVLQDFEIAHMIAAHVHPAVRPGAIAIGSGFINAAADEITITVQGRGGHGAYPNEATDAVAAIAHIAIGLPEVVRRTVPPLRPAIISIGTMTAGEGAANVLPGEARIRATMRTTTPADREALLIAVEVLATHQAAAYGAEAVVDIQHGEPVLLNDAILAGYADDWLARLGIDGAEPMRSLGADDFSYYCDAVPSVMCFVGVETAGLDPQPPLHHPQFLPTEAAVGAVAQALLAGYLAGAERILGHEHHRSQFLEGAPSSPVPSLSAND